MKKYLLTLGMIALLLFSSGSTLAQTNNFSSTFTYQGYLSNTGGPVNAICDMQFGLFNQDSYGTQIGSTLDRTNVTISQGSFTVQLNFGAGAFNGLDRFLEISVRCPAGSGGYTILSPRQPITAVPYALSLYGLAVQYKDESPNLVGGYVNNSLFNNSAVGATISGGGNYDSVNRVSDSYGTVGGGAGNWAGDSAPSPDSAPYATISGGFNNTASGILSVIGGGYYNIASGSRATIGGGQLNNATDSWTTVGGGYHNTSNARYATVGGGLENNANNQYATVAGGTNNTANSDRATVGGGGNNAASSSYATVPGGQNNVAGGPYAFAAGRNAQAILDGSFVWGDSLDYNVTATALNQFMARATGGFQFITAVDGVGTPTAGVQVAAGGGSWSSLSDRNMKANIAAVNGKTILDLVAQMPIATWNYISQDASIRHIGPMAQDFYTAFGVGEDNTHINTIDSEGVALAAIQGLYQIVQSKDAEIADLQAKNADLQTKLDNIESRLSALEQSTGTTSAAGINLHDAALMLVGLALVGVWSIKRHSTKVVS